MSGKEISLATVKEHNTAEDLWIVIENKVYDVTKYQKEHPGGEDALIENAGRDATKDFIDVGHSKEAREIMKKFYIGDLAASDIKRKKPTCREISIVVGAVVAGVALVYLIKRGIAARR